MRVGFPGGPRLEWYDRNPQPQSLYYSGIDVGPHSSISRFSYTVPTGKKFFLENANVLVLRKTAATTEGQVEGYISARIPYIVYAELITNNVGDRSQMNVGRSVIMQAGELLNALTFDLSTGGTLDYIINAHGIEFDA